MRILVVHEDKRSYGKGGGAETLLRDQTQALRALGHEVEWYQGETAIQARVAAFKPDICHVMTVHNFMGFGPVRWLQKNSIPHVWAIMDYWPFCGGRMLLTDGDVSCAAVCGVCDNVCDNNPVAAHFLSTVNHSPIMALNEYSADIYRRNGMRCDYVATLGVDHDYYHPEPSRRIDGRILTMSAWPASPTKGMHIFKAALKMTGYSGSLITGQPRDKVRDLLQTADIFVFPSCYQETWGLCLTEALACGCACIASDVAGPRAQIEHGVNGLLVEGRNSQALADALVQVKTDKALKARLQRGARASIEQRMTLAHMATQLETVYRSVIDG